MSGALRCTECGAKLRSAILDDGDERPAELVCPNGCEQPAPVVEGARVHLET